MAEPTPDEALATFEDYLRAKGLKMTDQRRTMVRAALAHAGHFTAEDLHGRRLHGRRPRPPHRQRWERLPERLRGQYPGLPEPRRREAAPFES